MFHYIWLIIFLPRFEVSMAFARYGWRNTSLLILDLSYSLFDFISPMRNFIYWKINSLTTKLLQFYSEMQKIINLKYNFMTTYKNFYNLCNLVSVKITTGRCHIDHSRERGVIFIHRKLRLPLRFVAFFWDTIEKLLTAIFPFPPRIEVPTPNAWFFNPSDREENLPFAMFFVPPETEE